MKTILSNSTRKLLWFEITKMLIRVLKNCIVQFIILFGTLSFPIGQKCRGVVNVAMNNYPNVVKFHGIF